MTYSKQTLGARRRGELNRDRGSRQLSAAILAQRHLNTARDDRARTKADWLGPSDPRYAYLTHSHDYTPADRLPLPTDATASSLRSWGPVCRPD
jgi:hypothetical protein